jgi:hypothetical protein
MHGGIVGTQKAKVGQLARALALKFCIPNPDCIAYDYCTSLVTLSLHHAVCLVRKGEVYQVWEDAKVKVGAVWKACKERFTRACLSKARARLSSESENLFAVQRRHSLPYMWMTQGVQDGM